jgi:hypothetical protein
MILTAPPPRIFPALWDWRRVAEFTMVAYQGSRGAVAFCWPDSLYHSSYQELLHQLSAQEWGLLLWLVAVLHASALFWNGRRPLWSTSTRVVACIAHLYIMVLVGVAYLAVEDFPRLVTVGFLIFAILAAFSISAEDVNTVLRSRYIRHKLKIAPDDE